MEEQFAFKAASIGGQDNTIVISVRNAPFTEDDVKNNEYEASRLAEQLALWLTPATTRKLRAKLSAMGY